MGAFIGMPPLEACGVGYPITYQYDITLILLVNGGSPDDTTARQAQEP
jgi:hypothetical protein